MSEHDVKPATAIQGKIVRKPVLEVSSRAIKNPHNFQFYVDYGVEEFGPWAAVGLNQTEYFLGYKLYEYHEYAPADAATQPEIKAGNVLRAIVKTLA